MVLLSSISRRGVPVVGVAASASASACAGARRPSSSVTAAPARLLVRQLKQTRDDHQATATLSRQRRKLSAGPAPIQARVGGTAAAAAPTTAADATAAASGASPQAASAVEEKGKGGSSGGGGGDVGEELWIVGRILEDMDIRLGAKQEKLRVREIGVIQRYAAIISTLDGSLELREGDDFLGWLRSQGFDDAGFSSPSSTPSSRSTPRGGSGAEDGVDTATTASESSAKNSGGVSGSGGGGGEAMEGAKKRAELEAFLSAASARLNALVAGKEEALFGDRGEEEAVEGKGSGVEREKGAAAAAAAAAAVSTNMSDEDLYQARLGAHRAMLCHCISLLLSSLKKQQLKTGLGVEEVAPVVRSLYLAAPEDRLGAIFPLFDTHGDGHLDVEGVERAVDAAILPVAVAAERCYLAAARPALDKKAAAVMPATMKYALWDVLEVPVKRRCCFAWAEDRKQVGPDEWRVSWEQFAPSRRKSFPEFESVAENYVAEFSKRRSAWHESRKGRREAIVYGSALLVGVLFIDSFLKMV
ncbi:unnamed protein product [Pylaiella littoralis]